MHPVSPVTPPPVETPPASNTLPTIIYVLFLANIMVPFTGLIGVIMAYINRGDNIYLDSHYQFQIRTFWIGLLFGFIGFLLLALVIGWLVLFLVVVWLIVRCAIGLKYLNKQQAIPNPTSWGTGR
ncbi:membrane protein [Thiosulfatimonas sediminis]|uniref:Membrane protein n=1 Tax=Thiosulfatimonas sediminis TaxID=2675054 RepID=A0A6F8PR73_9GAMM|nr:hypothetical protein [Thiosulfatimonas sediminis]BBP44632.1 membrane protein [Thiosulfatimonas sediminis]